MKLILRLTPLFFMVACTHSIPYVQKELVLRSDGKVMVAGKVLKFGAAQMELGSPDVTEINIVACSNLSFYEVKDVVDGLSNTGYKHISFTLVDWKTNQLCSHSPPRPKASSPKVVLISRVVLTPVNVSQPVVSS